MVSGVVEREIKKGKPLCIWKVVVWQRERERESRLVV